MKIIPFAFLFLVLNVYGAPANTPDDPAPPSDPETGDVGTVIPSRKAYPTGPFKDGKYKEAVGEEKQAEEERIRKDEEETRVNRFGRNKL